MEPQRHYDVIIVGAGMAGLAAADTLQQQGKSYVILEGRDRCGGRTLTQHAEKGWLDMGAEFVGATQNYMQQYIQRFNLLTLETYLPTDKNWLYEDAAGTILQFPGNDPLALPGGEEADALLGVFDQLTLNVRAEETEQPWRSLGASQLDAITAEQFVLEYSEQQRKRTGKGLSPRTMQIFTVSVRSAFSVEPSQLSMLFLLYYAATAGTYSSLIDVTGARARPRRRASSTARRRSSTRSSTRSAPTTSGARTSCSGSSRTTPASPSRPTRAASAATT